MANNNLGINAYSGPMGQKEPAYGTAETMKVLSKIGVEAPPSQNAAKKSQRAASKGKTTSKPQAPPPEPQIAGESAPVASYDQEMTSFWVQAAAQPGASPMVQQLAQEAQAGNV